MDIANPIYDAAFKYLMDDKKVASLIIGAITEFEIEDIELRPTEMTVNGRVDGHNNFTVYRLDFAAKVRCPDGSRVVLIEIQKAKYYTDILRFRNYLGSQYSSKDNIEKIFDSNGIERNRALPIYSIYILGHALKKHQLPVIRIKRSYIDVATGQELKGSDEFVESLTHDCTIIQVPELKLRRRNRLERMLGVFDQALIDPSTAHVLRIREEEYPEEYRVIVRRLLMAISEQEVRKRMTVEDEVLSELEARDRAITNLGDKYEEERRQKEEERRQKEEERRQKEEERRQKEEALEKLNFAVEALVSMGKTREEALRILKLGP